MDCLLVQPSVDVEATVRDGALDVGVFGPTDLVSLDDADFLMEGIRRELIAACDPEGIE